MNEPKWDNEQDLTTTKQREQDLIMTLKLLQLYIKVVACAVSLRPSRRPLLVGNLTLEPNSIAVIHHVCRHSSCPNSKNHVRRHPRCPNPKERHFHAFLHFHVFTLIWTTIWILQFFIHEQSFRILQSFNYFIFKKSLMAHCFWKSQLIPLLTITIHMWVYMVFHVQNVTIKYM